MTIILIANVGNRDLWVDKAAPIPGKAHPQWNENASRRALGKALQLDWSSCGPYLSLPIIGKAVDYVRRESGQIDQVVLISSDQSEREGVADRYLAQDTCELAPVIERLLVEQYAIGPGAITQWMVRDNPADYSDMQVFYRQHLAALSDAHPGATFYLEVSGGTPAMTSMLLTVGSAALGLNARPLYVSPHEDQPFPLDLGRRLVAESLIGTIRAHVSIYAYHAAANTVSGNADLLGDFIPVDALVAVLEYARQRINFNFDLARAALAGMQVDLWSDELERLTGDLREAQPEWLLQEICHNAQVKLCTGAFADFLARVFRFDEAVLRFTARRLGAHLTDRAGDPDPDGEFLDPAWLDSHPDLIAYMKSKKVHFTKAGNVSANRFVLQLAIAFLTDLAGDPVPRALLKHLGKLHELSKVRNKSFAVHTFEGVSRQRMAKSFIGPDATGTDEEINEIVDVLRAACEMAAGQLLDEVNPYDRINALCLELMG